MINKTKTIKACENITGVEFIDDYRAEKYFGGSFKVSVTNFGDTEPSAPPISSDGSPLAIDISGATQTIGIMNTLPGSEQSDSFGHNFTVQFLDAEGSEVIDSTSVSFGRGLTNSTIESAISSRATTALITQTS